MKERPIIVGSGPSGLFAGLILAENGYNPLIIERGDEIDKRVRKVEDFFSKGILDDNSNVQFGEGGAGTFSDGKLNTLIKNENLNQKKVFETFVKFGAKEEILYENHPHIGTDLLRNIIKNMRNYMISLGASFRYNTTLTDIKIENGKVCFIEVNNKEIIPCDVLILAIGHSARDTFRMLSSHNLDMSAKPFAIGVRVEHPQELINDSQYNGKKNLPNASYKLTHTCQNGRGAYSFCMCPGGYVLNASSAKGYLVVNGMSNYKRDTKNANSAVVVTVSPKDFGNNALDGIRYQEEIEKKAYNVLNGKIPLQLFEDFLENKISNNYGNFMPVLKGDYGYANLNEILPKYICDSLKEAIINFDVTFLQSII